MRGKFAIKLIVSTAVILLIVLLLKELNIYNLIRKQIFKQEYSEYVNKYAEENGIDPMWIYAIIKVESNFNSQATSGSGAKGLMQLMDNTAIDIANELKIEKFEANMLYNPEINIMIGVRYFDKLLSKYNENYYLAIAAYNGGIGNVDNWLNKGIISYEASDIENIPYKETNMYVRKTINAHKAYVELYA